MRLICIKKVTIKNYVVITVYYYFIIYYLLLLFIIHYQVSLLQIFPLGRVSEKTFKNI